MLAAKIFDIETNNFVLAFEVILYFLIKMSIQSGLLPGHAAEILLEMFVYLYLVQEHIHLNY